MAGYLYLVRHGETLFNAHHRIQGFCDSPLTEKGKQQAGMVKRYFKANQIFFDHAYCSTQERAVDTLTLITSQPYEQCKGLKEWNFGEFEGENEYLNPPMKPGQQTYGDFFAAYHGERDVEVQKRVCDTLDEIMGRAQHHQVLAVSHGGAIYMFLRAWHQVETPIKLPNCCILKFRYEHGQFALLEIVNAQQEEDMYG